MKKQMFFYFLTIFIVIQILFYLSNGLEREQERRGFIKCWSGSSVPGRPEWRQDCSDPSWKEKLLNLVT